MKRLLFAISLTMLCQFGRAQKTSENIFLELGGPGFMSANYDTRLSKSEKGIGVRGGLGIISDLKETGFTLPVGVNYLAGKGKNFLEFGVGVTYVYFPIYNQDQAFDFKKESFLVPHAWVGYRYQPLKGFTFRAGLCQYLTDLNLPTILGVPSLYPAVSFGYSF